MRRPALLVLALLAGCRGAAPKPLPQVDGACIWAKPSDPEPLRLPCAQQLARRGCAMGHEPSCALQKRIERRLLELAAEGDNGAGGPP